MKLPSSHAPAAPAARAAPRLLRSRSVLAPLLRLTGALGLAGLMGCSLEDQRTLGDSLSGPFAVVGQPGTRNVFVLNSAFSGQTVDGSLVRFELDPEGKALGKREATSVPRLGRDMAMSPDGKLLAVSFAEGSSRLKFFSVSPGGGLSPLGFEVASERGLISHLQFLSPKDSKPGEYLFTHVEDPGDGITSRVVVSRLTATGAREIVRLPDDLPASDPADYDFGYTSPAFDQASGLLVAFPQGSRGTSPELPSAEAFSKGAFDRKETDLRYVSLAVVKLDALLTGGNVAANSAFYPLLYNADLGGFDKRYKDKEGPNASAFFRASYSAATSLDQGGCLRATGAGSTDTRVPGDTVFAADDTLQEVLAFSNWAPVREAFGTLEALTGERHKERLLSAGPKIGFYSRKKDVGDLDANSRISRIRIVRRGNDCVPVWLRVEEERASQGNERSRLQSNFKRASSDPVKVVHPVRGSTSFGVLSLGTGAATRAFVFTASYSFADVRGFEYKAAGGGKDSFVALP